MSYILKPFNEFASVGNLHAAWEKFRSGKSDRPDVITFERHLESGLVQLSEELLAGTYAHGDYHKFFVRDPKYREIDKATVRDRIVHQALYSILYPLFDQRFFFDSYSCRINKGTQAAIAKIWQYIRKESENFNREVYVFHGDVDSFFSSVDHNILFRFLTRKIRDWKYLCLCKRIIISYNPEKVKGIPLGNLTSQIFANIYMHELDYFVKQKLGVHSYVRYNDDFFVVSTDKNFLTKLSLEIREFLMSKLKLSLPENKIIIRSLSQGIDILGAVAFPYGLVPRKRLRIAALKVAHNAKKKGYNSYIAKQLSSYIGLLSQTKSFMLKEKLRLSLSN